MSERLKGAEYVAFIQEQIKKEGLGWTAGHTSLVDLTEDKVRSLLTGTQIDPHEPEPPEISLPEMAPPRRYNWRDVSGSNYVSPVKDQGSCGSCAVFAMIASAESKLRIAARSPDRKNTESKLPPLSEANAYFCDGQKCSGTNLSTMANRIIAGVVPGKNFPYVCVVPSQSSSADKQTISCYSKCEQNKGAEKCQITPKGDLDGYYTKGYGQLRINFGGSAKKLAAAVYQHGPLALAYIAPQSFIAYKDGIYRRLPSERDTLPNPRFGAHGLCIVGYDEDRQSFLLKNSWGTSWGANGFVEVAFDEIIYFDDVRYMTGFSRIFTENGLLYDDIYIRNNLDDIGTKVRKGVLISPDIIPYAETVIPDAQNMLAESWYEDIGKSIHPGPNYIYVRGNCLANTSNGSVPYQMHLYHCEPSLLAYPSQWQENIIRTASGGEHAGGKASFGEITVPDEPFFWDRQEGGSENEACGLIARVSTSTHPNPIPSVDNIEEFAGFIAANPGFAFRNVAIAPKNAYDFFLKFTFDMGNRAGEIRFCIAMPDDAPIGAECLLNSGVQGMQFDFKTGIDAAGITKGILVDVKANTQGDILFGYKKGSFDGGRPWSLVVQAIYLLPVDSVLLQQCPLSLLDVDVDVSANGVDTAVEIRKAIVVGEYHIKEENA